MKVVSSNFSKEQIGTIVNTITHCTEKKLRKDALTFLLSLFFAGFDHNQHKYCIRKGTYDFNFYTPFRFKKDYDVVHNIISKH